MSQTPGSDGPAPQHPQSKAKNHGAMPPPASASASSSSSTPGGSTLNPAQNEMVLSKFQQAPTNPFPAAGNPFAPAAPATASPSTSNNSATQATSSNAPVQTPDLAAILAQALQAQNNNGGQQAGSASTAPHAYVSASQLHPPTPALATNVAGPSSAGPPIAAAQAQAANKKARRSPSPPLEHAAGAANKQTPPFMNKLRSMVDDSATDDLIRWQPGGKTFTVPNIVRFSQEVLPRFFKHGNFSSFVRQLNMYGFHKVPSLQQGSLRHEQEMEIWEFENENFVRENPELMSNIQRKAKQKGDTDENEEDKTRALIDGKVEEGLNSVSGALMRTGGNESESLMQLSNVWQAIQAIQSAQTSINDNLRHLHMSNDQLWQDAIEQKRRSEQQSDTINKMLRFLAGVFGGHDVLSGSHNSAAVPSPGSPSTRNRQRGRTRGPGGRPAMYSSGSSSGQLLIENGRADDIDSDNNNNGSGTSDHAATTRGEQIQELFSRISEAGSNDGTPRGSNSPDGGATPKSPPSRFSQLRSPQESPSGSSTPQPRHRPALLGETPRRQSTPGRSRGFSTPNQIFQALATGEGQAFLQQLLGANTASHSNGGQNAPNAPKSGAGDIHNSNNSARLDPSVLSAFQGALSALQSNNSGHNPSTAGSSAQSDCNRFIYPYHSGNTPNSSLVSPGPLSQTLSHADQSAESVQQVINSLVEAFGNGKNGTGGTGDAGQQTHAGGVGGEPNLSSNAYDPGTSGFPAGILPSGTTPGPSGTNDAGLSPGDWNQYNGTPIFSGAGDAGSHTAPQDLDLESLMSQFVASPGPGVPSSLPSGVNGGFGMGSDEADTSPSRSGRTDESTPGARAKRKLSIDGKEAANPKPAPNISKGGDAGARTKRGKTSVEDG